ncbi:hypothetical protein ABI59_20200 [Acidobacteria bacterium Mor1]|nr:hypothetical protein ABI59_20200 [Acidobacteria bacterium Mor1]
MHATAKRRRRWPWILGGLVVLLLVGALLALQLIDVERFRGPIERALEDSTGWDAELGEISLSLTRGLAVSVSPVTLSGPPDTSSIELGSIDVRADLMPLIRGQLKVRSVGLVDPQIELVRRSEAEGWIVPGSSGNDAAAGTPDGGPSSPGAPGGSPSDGGPSSGRSGGDGGFEVTVDRIDVAGGRLLLEDRAADPPLRLELREVGGEYLPQAGTLRLGGNLDGGGALEFRTEGPDALHVDLSEVPSEQLHPLIGTDLLHAGGRLTGGLVLRTPEGSDMRLEGDLQGEQVTLLAGNTPFDEPVNTRFAVALGAAETRLESLSLTADGIALSGAGNLAPNLDLDLSIADMALERLLAASDSVLPLPLELEPPGRVSATIEVDAPAGQALTYAASGNVSAARYIVTEGLPAVKDAAASFTLDRAGELIVDITGGSVAGGAIDGRARIDSLDPPGTLTLEGGVQEAILGQLIGPFVADASQNVKGATGLQAALGLDLSAATDLRGLKGVLELNTRDATVPGWDLDAMLEQEIERQRDKLGDLGKLLEEKLRGDKKDEQPSKTEEVLEELFESMDARIDFDAWPWNIERLALAGGGVATSGSGTFDPENGAVDFTLTTTFSPERTAALVGKTKELQHLVDGSGQLVLPLELNGPLLRPGVSLDLGGLLAGKLGVSGDDSAGGLLEGLLKKEADKRGLEGSLKDLLGKEAQKLLDREKEKEEEKDEDDPK